MDWENFDSAFFAHYATMLEQVANAFTNQDYQTAAKLLKVLVKESPDDLWVQFYVGRLKEVSQKDADAEKIYKRILRKTSNNKLLTQARQGLQRLEQKQKQSRDAAIATATIGNQEPGLLILEPIAPEKKQLAAQQLAKIMQIDAYSARLQLPSRGWRWYRVGAMGELKFYGEALLAADIPCFWTSFSQLQQIQVFQVNYFQRDTNPPTVTCHRDRQQGSITFDWSEVTAKVTGLLPIFEQVVDINVRRQLERKTQTQDYAQLCDLHLPGRNIILRLCDRNYQFVNQKLANHQENQTIRTNWNYLQQWLNLQIANIPTWSEFTPFAESSLDNKETLSKFPPHLNLFRPQPSLWDNTFQVYSCLILAKNQTKR